VTVALWSSEVLSVLRRRLSSFLSLCPDPADAFGAWWAGTPPVGYSSTLVLLDPVSDAESRRRMWVGLEHVPVVRPRYRGYAEALAHLRAAGMA
jgi:hypothetical protein